jgi:gamma-glutamyltranspeptidase/glutathione hydrolase
MRVSIIVLVWCVTPWVDAAHPAAPRGSGGAVASAAPAATRAGIEMLEAGGNAADAAVATALALAVVHPQAGNLGGGGFAVVRFGDETTALDFRETAPARASAGMYLDANGDLIPDSSLIGPLAAGTPGSPAGLAELHQRYGRLEWARVVEPAIRLAADGFEVTPRLADALADSRELLERFPETSRIWVPDGRLPVPGDLMRIPDLASTLRAYADRGPKALTEGAAAVTVEAVSRRYGGILRAADLEHYRPVWREPIRFRAFGWDVASMPLPSSGGIILGQVSAMLERIGWAAAPRFGAARAHLFAESCRRSYADRFLLGDPRTSRASSSELLDGRWLSSRARSIDRNRATPSTTVRSWPDTGKAESPETTHLSVVDADGNVVSLTTTLNGSFGCGLVVPGMGYLLNNEMDDFAAAPGRPNQFGLVQGEANAVGPGKRMLSSMAPTVAWAGDVTVAVGSPGGSRIPTATLQVLLNLVVDGDPLQAAVDRPRVHHQWLPDRLEFEADALSPETRVSLERRGHVVRERDAVGEVCAVRRLGDGTVEAAADPRGPGAAAVVRPGH